MKETAGAAASVVAPDFLGAGGDAALQSDVAFLRSILASSRDCIKVLDLDGNLVFMTEGGQQVMDVSDFNAIRGCPWPDFWQGSGNADAKVAVAAAKAGGTGHFRGPASTMAGISKYWDVMVTPIRGPDGRPEKLLAVSRDITVGWEAERQRGELVQELAHRIKNTLAMVKAIANQTFQSARTIEEGRNLFASRLTALAEAQELLTQANWKGAGIRTIVDAALAPHRTAEGRIRAQGPDLELTAQQGLGLSLGIYELATNAAKYGALSNDAGRVDIRWGAEPGRAFVFEWRESGGPAVAAPKGQGFGTRLVERVLAAYFEGEGKLCFDPGGLAFRLTGRLATAE